MRIIQFATATLATLLFGSLLVAQQTVPGQAPIVKPQQAQGQQAQGQQVRGQQAQGQQVQGRKVQPVSGQAASAGSARSNDQTFAQLLEIAHEEQIAIARFAQENATHDDVKAFAATMEKEHQSCLEEIQGLTSKGQPSSTADTSGSRASDRLASSKGSQEVGFNASSLDFVQLQQEISQQCLEDSKEWLSNKEGIEIDKCFVGMQVAKHAGMKSYLTVLERHATGELQGLIKKELKTNESHLQAAVSLMEKLTGNDSSRSVKTSAK